MARYFRQTSLIVLLFLLGDIAVFHFLKRGMDRYYGLDKSARILSVGHSHSVLGIDAQQIEASLGVGVSKYATAGANTLDRLWMVRHFVSRHPELEVVIYDVDPRLFDSEGLSSASYTLFLPYMDDPVMRRYMKQESSWQEYYVGQVIHTSRFRDQTLNIALRGVTGRIENKKQFRMRLENYQGVLAREKERRIRINPAAVACFQETISFLTGKNITVVLVFIPVVDLLNAIDPASQKRVIDIFSDLARDNNHVIFLDYNKDYESRHDLFYDLRHLNEDGNAVITGRLIEDLKRL
jgi:hypothetical protein